ncbi:MAG TPA: DUF502 domain-containing protein [Verrucomicrobiae bacterium]|nr:DUF502 domain-containing protein [Verrucomicrobiae bacterium]
MKKSLFARWRSSFLTGLAVILPAIISIAALSWVFKTVSNITDLLLFFLPKTMTHEDGGAGAIHWYWSVLALVFAVLLVTILGVLARYYIGKRLIAWADGLMLRLPVLNKIYGTIKQVDDAFTSGKKSSFKTVALVEYPCDGIYSVGFITSEQPDEVSQRTGRKCVCVFIPMTPIPTGGFLILVPEEKVIKLDISVADGFKYIISLGAIANDSAPPVIK